MLSFLPLGFVGVNRKDIGTTMGMEQTGGRADLLKVGGKLVILDWDEHL
jgi:hypothetical protein